MLTVRLTRKAQRDLAAIYKHTVQEWGQAQAEEYAEALEACCDLLATMPLIGRPCHGLDSRFFRFEHGSHVIFYRVETDTLVVSRILHQRMIPLAEYFRSV